jgi:methionyl-tRNA formyltransferase
MEIRNRFRAFTPRPGVFAMFRGKKVKLAFDLGPSPHRGEALPPGTLLSPAKGQLAVICGDGVALPIAAVTPEGKKAMAVVDFMNGYRLTDSDVLT